ncbi:hypothetical protein Y032_0520g2855 [Ancylostoma ceylanicum]|uniref:G-protein coupled receptors family 1 profile domain-containing protein n=1 Tax=Ancylostoma ceylanicum TaxID=53326 RepID=A0A016WT08_9BILA|nr:hypothetical protein Y032_0520g2855 [Ancylostoma ceylanicum]
MEQAECFRLLFLHLFFGSAQSLMYFMMALDMLLAIGIPIRHKVWPKITYVIMMCVPPILFAFIACVISYSSTERGTPKICGPQATTAHGVATLSMFFLMAANTAAVVMVIIVVVITRRRGRNEFSRVALEIVRGHRVLPSDYLRSYSTKPVLASPSEDRALYPLAISEATLLNSFLPRRQ